MADLAGIQYVAGEFEVMATEFGLPFEFCVNFLCHRKLQSISELR